MSRPPRSPLHEAGRQVLARKPATIGVATSFSAAIGAMICLGPALAQAPAQAPAQPPAAFDMGKDARPPAAPADTAPPAISPGASVPAGAMPAGSPPAAAPFAVAPFAVDPAAPSARPARVPAAQPSSPAPAPASVPAPAAGTSFKPLLPAARLSLDGEVDARAFAFYLTQDESTADVNVDVAFQNALLVMPEASRLMVSVNGERVLEAPIASSDRPRKLTSALRKGLLRPGQNVIRFEAIQRHRTDCTVASTFDLWTHVEAAGTGLTFRNMSVQARRLRSIDDLPAIGTDLSGRTVLRMIVPSAVRTIASNRIFAIAQAIALRGRYAQMVVEVTDRADAVAGPGRLNVVLATTGELDQVFPQAPAELQGRSFLGFVQDQRLGPSTLVITGNTWQDIDSVVDMALTNPVTRPLGQARSVIETAAWHVPDAPYMSDARRIRLSDLGIATQESSGRRLRVRAMIAMPGDFYAQAYGEAHLYLDAAFSSAVRPGDSHIEVYVNGRIAATMPLNASEGGLFQHFPISIPLRNFRAGINEIWLETVTLAASDLSCGPGATLPGPARFVLLDTSEFVLPNFARIGVKPNLAATAGTGFPYVLSPQVAVVLGRHDPANYAAAATLLARMAQQASRPLKVDALTSASAAGTMPVIAVGAAGQFPAGVLPRVGVAENVRTVWPARADAVIADPANSGAAVFDAVVGRFQEKQGAPRPAADDQPRTTDEVSDQWKRSVGGPLARNLTIVDQWLQRTFDLSFAQLRAPLVRSSLYEPASGTDLIVAQANDEASGSVWTAFVVRKEDALESTVARLAMPGNWANLSGKITAYQGTQGLQTQAADAQVFVATRPFSIGNMRLIAANWMSSNIGAYALALIAGCVGLGIATSTMLSRLGRRS